MLSAFYAIKTTLGVVLLKKEFHRNGNSWDLTYCCLGNSQGLGVITTERRERFYKVEVHSTAVRARGRVTVVGKI